MIFVYIRLPRGCGPVGARIFVEAARARFSLLLIARASLPYCRSTSRSRLPRVAFAVSLISHRYRDRYFESISVYGSRFSPRRIGAIQNCRNLFSRLAQDLLGGTPSGERAERSGTDCGERGWRNAVGDKWKLRALWSSRPTGPLFHVFSPGSARGGLMRFANSRLGHRGIAPPAATRPNE